MAFQAAYLNSGALAIAGDIQAFVALSKLRLFKAPLSVTPGLTKAALVAVEANYDGYVAKTVTAFLAPYLDPAGGASIQSGTQQFMYGPAAVPPVTNDVYGFWLEDAGGDVLLAVQFDASVAMAQVGDGIPVNAILNFGRS